ncbi:MAG: zinc ABC transporter substrate-binding protein [Rhodospirillales bacterium]|nr:zinc ABC transporter substrate-binding protein [Rhodospirillales bacterium]
MRCWALLAALLAFGASAQAETPRGVVSLAPLHSLAAAVMAEIGEPVLLLDGPVSPHGYALKPSQARLLAKADLILWIGPALEGFLVRPVGNLGKTADRLEVLRLPDLDRQPRRAGGVWGDEHDDHAPPTTGRYDGLEWDGHVWLDPGNAIRIAQALAERLAALDPANAARYRANAGRLAAELEGLDGELRSMLTPLAGTPYLVFHDAYQYLEKRYGLTPIGALAIDPDHKPSAKTLQTLRERLRAEKAACLFSEPQFDPALMRIVAEGTMARQSVLDPLGADLPRGPTLYPSLMRRLADALSACLK